MPTFCKRLIAASTAISMLAVAGVATAEEIPSSHRAHTNPSLRVYPFCPGHDRHAIRSTTIGASKMLVPAGARQVLLCTYSGTLKAGPGAPAFSLTAHHLVSGRTRTTTLGRELGALKPTAGSYSCPADNGSAIIAFFRYGSAPKADDPVTVGLGGCSTITNGHLHRLAGVTAPGRRLIQQLERLAKSP